MDINDPEFARITNRIENTSIFFCKKINAIISNSRLEIPCDDNNEISMAWIKALVLTTSAAVATFSKLSQNQEQVLKDLSEFVITNFEESLQSIIANDDLLKNKKLHNDIKNIMVE